MFFWILSMLCAIYLFQLVWCQRNTIEKALILPFISAVIYAVVLIGQVDFGTMKIPYTIFTVMLWITVITKVFNKKPIITE